MVSLPEPNKAVSNDSADAAWKPRSTLVGTLLANRYRITDAVGQGSTGAVFRADDVLKGRTVAIRILVPSLAQRAPLIAQIRARIEQNTGRDQEALVNLVDITDVGMTLEGEVFIVTDFLDGDHLSTMLSRGGRLPWSRARSLLIRLGQILHGFHRQGIVAGTLEARHCFAVRAKAKQEAIKIVHNPILEHLASAIGPTGGHGVAMIARYVAPERICGEPIDARTDVYSLGVIAYELLTGQLPFSDPNPIRLVSMHLQKAPPAPRSVAPDAAIAPAVEAILIKCLAKDPADRFPDMEALTDALTAIPESATDSQDADTPTAAPISPAVAASPSAALPIAASPSVSTSPSAPSPISAPPTATSPDASPPLAAPPDASSPVAASPVTSPVAPSPIAATPVAAAPVAPSPLAASPAVPTVPSLGAVAATTRQPTLPLGSAITESGKLRLPPPPTLGAPRVASGPVPVTMSGRPPTLGLSLPPPPSLSSVPAPAPRAPSIPTPSATLPAGTLVAPPSPPVPSASPTPVAADAVPSARTRPPSTATPVPTIVLPGPVPPPNLSADPPTAPFSALAAPVPSASLSAATPTAPPTAPPVTPVPSASPSTPEPITAASLLADAGPRSAAPVPSAILATSDSDAIVKAEEDPSRLRARIAAFTADEVRRKNPLRMVSPSAMAETRIGPAPVRPIVDDEPPAPTPVVAKPAAVIAPPAPRLHVAPPVEPSVTSAESSLIDEQPRRRGWLIGAISLAAAAGIAFIVTSSPSFSGSRQPDISPGPAKVAAPLGPIPERVVTTPTKIAEAPTTPEPERATAVVAPDAAPPAEAPPAEAPPAEPAAVPTPAEPAAADAKPAAVDTPKKPATKKRRRSYEPENEPEREKDVFDQLREHMEAKKAAEAARLASIQNPTPPPSQPSPPPPTDDTARETLDRARQAAANNNPSLAYVLAKQSYNIGKSLDALELMGVSACRAKNEANARSALGNLSGTRRNAVMIACTQSGITL